MQPLHGYLFGEDQARYVVETADPTALIDAARAAGVPARVIGTVGGVALTLSGAGAISVDALKAIHEAWLPGFMARRGEQGNQAMAMDAAMIERLIKEGLPDAQVTIEDLRGDGDHYAAHVVSGAFRGKTRVQQHQMVYQALRGRMGNELHALALQTGAPED